MRTLTNAQQLAKARVEARKRGDCLTCRRRPVKEGAKSTCVPCIEIASINAEKRRMALLDAGRCTNCGGFKVRKHVDKCEACSRKVAAPNKARYDARRAAQLCCYGTCPAKVKASKAYCDKHSKKGRA